MRTRNTIMNTIMNSIAPIWDGSETWLVFGGLGLLAAFPLAFAIIIPAVHFPIAVIAARAHLPRTCLRVSLPRFRRHHLLGPRVLLWIGSRDLCAGDGGRRLHPGLSRRRRAIRRQVHPVILIYTAWSYWVFRGKVRSDVGYH